MRTTGGLDAGAVGVFNGAFMELIAGWITGLAAVFDVVVMLFFGKEDVVRFANDTGLAGFDWFACVTAVADISTARGAGLLKCA